MKVVKAPFWALAAIVAAGGFAVPPALAEDGPTFDQVLAAPDDINLNLEYARAQANQGHLLPAAAALERILLVRPSVGAVRLFYGVVLYRLNDLQEAQAQFDLVDPAQLTGLQRSELAKYRRLVRNGRQDTHINGNLAAGIAYDSNAAGALLTQFDTFFGSAPKEEGYAAVFSGRITGSTKVGTGDMSLYGSLNGYSRSDVSGPQNDLQYGEAEIGLMQTDLKSSWQAAGVVHDYYLFGDQYLWEYGGRVQGQWHTDTATTLTASFQGVWQDYNEPFIDSLASFIGGTHDGMRYTLEGDLAYRISSHSTINFNLGYEGKNAGYKPFGYDAPFFGASYHALMGRGIYLDLHSDWRWVHYRAVDPFFLFGLTEKRRDVDTTLRAALGVPLSAFTADGATGDELENITLEGSVTYIKRDRPTPLALYDSTGAQLRLVWHFGDDR